MNDDYYGRVWMHSLDMNQKKKKLKSVALQKKSIGDFIYYALRNGAEIGTIWPLNPDHHGSYVGITLKIHPDNIKKFEEESGFGLVEPPQIKLN